MTMYKALKYLIDNDIHSFSKYDLNIDSTTATGDHDLIIQDLLDNQFVSYTHTIAEYDDEDETAQSTSALKYYEITIKGRDLVKNYRKSRKSMTRKEIYAVLGAIAAIITVIGFFLSLK